MSGRLSSSEVEPENRTSPFIRGIPTGEYGTCAGQELEVWDIAITPGNTLLNY